jgi:hypothetical protein
LGSLFSVYDCANTASCLSFRSFIRAGSGISVYGRLRCGSSLSVLDVIQLGSSLSVRSSRAWDQLCQCLARCVLAVIVASWISSTSDHPSLFVVCCAWAQPCLRWRPLDLAAICPY